MPWTQRRLRDATVFVRTRANGALDTGSDGRVDVRYQNDEGAKVYRAAARNLAPVPGEEAKESNISVEVEVVERPHDPRAIVVYTDGACSGNPGPAGIGVVVLDGGKRRELSEYLGVGTNNIAELTAIERALDLIGDRHCGRPVVIHADSSYAIGLLAHGWRAKANAELVSRLRDKARRFPRLRFVKVEGHAGVPENERCDELARAAITKRIRP